MTSPCLVLDHDDTVVNSTATVHYPCFAEYTAKFFPRAKRYTLEEYVLKNFDPGVYDFFHGEVGMTEEDMKHEQAYWHEYVQHHVPQVYDGMRDILWDYVHAGGTICVVSHSLSPNILRDYRENKLPEPKLVYGWEVPKDRRKPQPHALYDIMEKLGFTAEQMLVLDGSDVTNLPEHKRAAFIGRVFQDPMMGTAPSMWIEENLALAARRGQRRGLSWGVTKEEKEQYRELLGGLGLGLESRLTTKVSTLSGGQRQALTLLMATLKRPKLLLLDEHTAALDPKTAAKVMELTDRIVREGQLTTLMITHNMRDAILYGNRLIMLHDGHVILDIAGEEKEKLTVPDLLEQFTKASGDEFANDRAILS